VTDHDFAYLQGRLGKGLCKELANRAAAEHTTTHVLVGRRFELVESQLLVRRATWIDLVALDVECDRIDQAIDAFLADETDLAANVSPPLELATT
jgi:hypothetical protein